MSNIVVDFLKSFAAQNSFCVFDSLYGEIFITRSSKQITQSSGAVYGIWVESTTSIGTGILEIPNYKNWYPIYWGKDIAPISRIKAHVQNHRNTGNINLKGIGAIQGKKVLYGSIFVEQYVQVESLLHNKHKPLKGSPKNGRNAGIIQITQ